MNKFEKYLKANKEHLEPQEVNDKVWLATENELLHKKSHRLIRLARYGAAAAIALIVGLLLWMNQGRMTSEEALLSRFNLSEHNFTQQIAIRKQKLAKATIPKDQLEDFQILLQQLEFLDGQFDDYLQYIDQNGYQDFIGDQIINHYKTKIKLLDKIQSEIEKIHYYESKKPSSSESVEINL